jgi:hypothetical protein
MSTETTTLAEQLTAARQHRAVADENALAAARAYGSHYSHAPADRTAEEQAAHDRAYAAWVEAARAARDAEDAVIAAEHAAKLAQTVEGFTLAGLAGMDTDVWVCPCGNTPDSGGFYAATIDAVELDPSEGGDWDARLYACAACGRVADQHTPGMPVLAGPQDFTPLPDEVEVPTYTLSVGKTAELWHLSVDALNVLARDVAVELSHRVV